MIYIEITATAGPFVLKAWKFIKAWNEKESWQRPRGRLQPRFCFSGSTTTKHTPPAQFSAHTVPP